MTGDLERHTKEQEHIRKDIEALQEQLRALQHDHTVLLNMRKALGGASSAVADTTDAPTVPHQSSAEPKQSKPKRALLPHVWVS
ncbi:hypothetical protein [Streptomyces sp. NPDC047009]|uniref:hypothetical protein n=1 Tax=Streptomyces sp. NPDC047009 TaxID=3154496 RepID=UPI0033D6059B